MQQIYEDLVNALTKGQNVVMATIISERGSAPRSSGTKMLIFADGTISGTIGGGNFEAQAITLAKEVHQERKSRLFQFRLNGKDASLSDMICGGSGDVFLQFLDAKMPVNLEIFKTVLEAAANEQKGWIITRFSEAEGENGLFFVNADHQCVGNGEIPQEKVEKLIEGSLPVCFISESTEGESFLIEQVLHRKKAFIFGGGHVSLEIVRLLSHLDFSLTVIEDRAEYAGVERFPEAQSIVASSFAQLPALSVEADSFIIIVTRGHLGDYDVLKRMLETEAGYIGMIGSRTKRELIYKRLREEGVSQTQIDRVHSPIGLPIKAETPAEIAISIAAEMVLARAEMK